MNEHFGPLIFLDWYFLHEEEYSALQDAQEGNPKSLGEFVRSGKPLQTHEAREWVWAKIVNISAQTTRRKTKQDGMYFHYFRRVKELTEQSNVSEYRARQIILDDEPELNEETLKTYIRKGKQLDAQIRKDIKKRRNQ